MRTAALALSTQKRVELERAFLHAGIMIHDEYSMLAGAMNHAASLLATYAREAKYRLRREDYALPRERYGRIPGLGYFGDHMQLPPIPKANSMNASLAGSSQEHRVGAGIFRQVRYVFQLEQMMRFKDPTLIRILQAMRVPGGQPPLTMSGRHAWPRSLITTVPVLLSLMSLAGTTLLTSGA